MRASTRVSSYWFPSQYQYTVVLPKKVEFSPACFSPAHSRFSVRFLIVLRNSGLLEIHVQTLKFVNKCVFVCLR